MLLQLETLSTSIKACKNRFNASQNSEIKQFEDLERKIRDWCRCLITRRSLCELYYEMFRGIDLGHLGYQRGDLTPNENEQGPFKVTIDGHKDCRLVVNLAIDGFFLNLSSMLDIFAHIANILLYENHKPSFHRLACDCSKPGNDFEIAILQNYDLDYYEGSNGTWINHFRDLRNKLAHEMVFHPFAASVTFTDSGDNNPQVPSIPIEKHYFADLPIPPQLSMEHYQDHLLSRMDSFLTSASKELGKQIRREGRIPLH